MRRVVIVRHGNTFRKGEISTRVGRKTDLPLVEEHRARSVGRYLTERGIRPDKLYAAPLKRTTQTAELIVEQMELETKVIAEERFSEIDYGPDENKTEREVEERLGQIEMDRGSSLIGIEGDKRRVIPKDSGCQADTDSMDEQGGSLGKGEQTGVYDREVLGLGLERIIELGRGVIERWDSSAIVPDGWSVDPEAIITAWNEFADGVAEGETLLICSSNGVIRFAPHILSGDYKEFSLNHNIKVATGSVSIFTDSGQGWVCEEWNTKPYEIYREM